MIAFDRYNVIVKGIAGKPMTIKGAILKIFCIYMFASIWTVAPVLGWNRFAIELILDEGLSFITFHLKICS